MTARLTELLWDVVDDSPLTQREEGILLLYRLAVLALYCLLGFLQ